MEDPEISLGTLDSSGGGTNWGNILSSALTGAGNAYTAQQRANQASASARASTALSKVLPIAVIGVVIVVVAMVFFKRG